MDKILIYMLIKHNFIWDEVYYALKNKEIIDKSEVNKTCTNIKSKYIGFCHYRRYWNLTI